MKVLLVRPFHIADEIQPPLGLGWLATSVRNKHEVEILDCVKENIKEAEFENFLLKKKFDVIGFQFYTLNKSIIKKTLKIIKRLNPKTKIIVGGPHPSATPNETMQEYPEIDFAFVGEAEEGFPPIINLIEKNKLTPKELEKIPGLVWRDNNRIMINEQTFKENLDELGFPAWDLLKPDTYPVAPHGAFFKQFPTAPIIVTRGCPYQCTFCAGHIVSGRRIRSRSIDKVIEEIELLHNKYGIKEIHIEDDNFTFYKDYVKLFCNKLIEKDMGITWNLPNGVRLDTLDEELLSLMKKSGLYSISVGIESGSPRILRAMKKSLTKEVVKKKIDLIRKVGLEVIGFFIVGYPGETKEDIERTIDFACSLDLKRANFMAFKPFPATEAYNLIKDDVAQCLKWDNFSLDKVVYAPKGMSQKELKNLRRKAFIRFYLRPRIIYKMLKEVKSFTHLKFILKRIFRWVT